MIFEKFPAGPVVTNTYVVGCPDQKKGIVIDPALGTAPLIEGSLSRLNLECVGIFLTHSHWDHIADVSDLKKSLGAAVYVHPLDQGNLKNPGSDGIPTLIEIPGVEPDHFLEDGKEYSVGNLTFKVIHTPGHSPGGVCFYFEKEGKLFSGDTLFKGSIGYLTLPTATKEDMWKSLHKLCALPPETEVYPGHGEMTTIGFETWLERAREIFS
jgi:hydroxyacylglutathione hydrolase